MTAVAALTDVVDHALHRLLMS